jgi:2,4-dienoyl-CoA reductase-like NADH-dependent reductase (Old Yellow Enzyme family)
MSGKHYSDVWNKDAGLDLVEAGTAHGYLLMVRFFI